MKKMLNTILIALLGLGTVTVSAQNQSQQNLPQIQLQEYTIVGLEKVVLPRKERKPILNEVEIRWVTNPTISRQSVPEVNSGIVRKPFLETTSSQDFYLWSSAQYASFNTLGLGLESRLVQGLVEPYLKLNYASSNGHVKFADWSKTGFELGVGSARQSRNFFDYKLVYNQDKNGIYGALNPLNKDLEVVDTDWQLRGVQQIRLHRNLVADGRIQYQNTERTAFIKNKLRELKAEAWLIWQKTSVGVRFAAGYQAQFLENFRGQSALPIADSSEQKNKLLESRLALVYQKQPYELRIGGVYQRVEEVGFASENNRNQLNPFISAAWAVSGNMQLSVRYHPEFRLPQLSSLLKSFPYANALLLSPTEYENQVTGEIAFTLNNNDYIKIESNYARVKSYPVATVSASIKSWLFTYIDEASLWENSLIFSVAPQSNFMINGWFTFRKTRINSYFPAVDSVENVGSRFPYQPDVEGVATVLWKIHPRWAWNTELVYEGERFNDVMNNKKLKAYWLVNVSLKFSINDQFRLILFAKNILNQKYDRWLGLEAPPFWGGFRIEFRR